MKNYVKSMINDSLRTVTVNLKVVAQIKEGDRLSINSNRPHTLAIQPAGWLTACSRWYRSESRSQCVEIIGKLVDDTKRIITIMLTNYFPDSGNSTLNDKADGLIRVTDLFKDLKNAIEGMNRLQVTYRQDSTTVAYIQLAIDEAQREILIHEQKFIDLRSERGERGESKKNGEK